jgi:hypothetical protein
VKLLEDYALQERRSADCAANSLNQLGWFFAGASVSGIMHARLSADAAHTFRTVRRAHQLSRVPPGVACADTRPLIPAQRRALPGF